MHCICDVDAVDTLCKLDYARGEALHGFKYPSNINLRLVPVIMNQMQTVIRRTKMYTQKLELFGRTLNPTFSDF